MKISKRDKTLLAVLGIVAILGGFWWYVVKPGGAELDAQRDQLAAIQGEVGGLRDTLSRLQASGEDEAARTAQRLRLAKALPDATETPGVMVQLQALADKANVELTSIKTNQYSDYGSIRATEFEVRVTGRFFDVDDFLYRMHRQVAVDEKDRPIVGGRLFATTSVDLTLAPENPEGGSLDDDDQVVGTLKVVAFSSVPAGGSAPVTAPAATPAPTTTTPAAPATAPATTPAVPAAAAGAPQATATPSSGGAQ
jgi:hypothetical protein